MVSTHATLGGRDLDDAREVVRDAILAAADDLAAAREYGDDVSESPDLDTLVRLAQLRPALGDPGQPRDGYGDLAAEQVTHLELAALVAAWRADDDLAGLLDDAGAAERAIYVERQARARRVRAALDGDGSRP